MKMWSTSGRPRVSAPKFPSFGSDDPGHTAVTGKGMENDRCPFWHVYLKLLDRSCGFSRFWPQDAVPSWSVCVGAGFVAIPATKHR